MPQTLQGMSDQELLGKVDQLFEWLKRQAGEGPIEDWTLDGIQGEIRRRVMEKSSMTTDKLSETPINVLVRNEVYSSERAGPSKCKLLHEIVLSRVGHKTQEACGLTSFERDTFLRAVRNITALGVPFVELSRLDE
ncbi:MAG: hypothetical protein AAB891_01950 [Patescibacteria group bacterium]